MAEAKAANPALFSKNWETEGKNEFMNLSHCASLGIVYFTWFTTLTTGRRFLKKYDHDDCTKSISGTLYNHRDQIFRNLGPDVSTVNNV